MYFQPEWDRRHRCSHLQVPVCFVWGTFLDVSCMTWVSQLLQSDRSSSGSSPIAATEDPTQFGSCSQLSPNNFITGSDSASWRLLKLVAVVKSRFLHLPGWRRCRWSYRPLLYSYGNWRTWNGRWGLWHNIFSNYWRGLRIGWLILLQRDLLVRIS